MVINITKLNFILIVLVFFTAALQATEWHWSGVVAGDYRSIGQRPEEREIENNAQLSDFFLKMEGLLTEKVPFITEFSIHQDGGLKLIRVETAYQPFSFLDLRIGQLLIPFGLYNERFRPDQYLTLTKPLFYAGPGLDYISRLNFPHPFFSAGFTDVGILGKFSLSIKSEKIDCLLYIVNGFKERGRPQPPRESFTVFQPVERIDIDWTGEDRFIWDNNDTKMAGERLVWQINKDLNIGSSGLIGKYDLDDELDHWILGADLSYHWKKANLYAEYANGSTDFRSALPNNGERQVQQRYSSYGYYWQADFPFIVIYPMDETRVIFGYDVLYRYGPKLDEGGFFVANPSPDIKTKIEKYTSALNLKVNEVFTLKGELSYWDFGGQPDVYEGGIGGVVKF